MLVVIAAGIFIGIAVGMNSSVECRYDVGAISSVGASVSRDSSASSNMLSQRRGPEGADQSVGEDVTADCSVGATRDVGWQDCESLAIICHAKKEQLNCNTSKYMFFKFIQGQT